MSHYGPYGYLLKPIGLNEEHWSLSDEPSEFPSEVVSVPLYAREPQALGVVSPVYAHASDEVARLAERLRARALHDGHSSDTHVLFCRDVHEAASLITALAARAEKAEREAEAWERRAGEAIMGEAAAVERATILESELSALRARLEEAGKVIERWVSWCDDWHAGKPHPSDDLAAARRFLEEAK